MSEKQAPAAPVKKNKILRRLIFFVVLIAIIAVAIFPKQTRDMAYQVYANLTDKELRRFSSVRDEKSPSYLAVVKALKASGLETDIDEFSVNEMDEADLKYRWRRGDQLKLFEVYRDHRDNWLVQEYEE